MPQITRNACEYHDEPGECTEECAYILNGMISTSYYDPYYTYDPTGCRRPPDFPELVAVYDERHRKVFLQERHSPDCECGCMNRCTVGCVFKTTYMGLRLF